MCSSHTKLIIFYIIGDACWEGIRIYDGRIFHLDHHLDRLFRSAKALGFENIHTRAQVTEAIFRVLAGKKSFCVTSFVF